MKINELIERASKGVETVTLGDGTEYEINPTLDRLNRHKCDNFMTMLEALENARTALGCASMIDKTTTCSDAFEHVESAIKNAKEVA